MKIVLVSGYKRSGKDFTGLLLHKLLLDDEVAVSTLSFASPMKRIIARTMGILPSQLEAYKNNDTQVKVKTTKLEAVETTTDYRKMLQLFGTEAMKSEFGEYVWTDLAWKQMKKSESDVVIITDWRFKEELRRLQYLTEELDEVSIVTVRVVRDGLVNTNTHISEIDLDDGIDFDYTIENDGKTVKQLTEQLRELIKESIDA